MFGKKADHEQHSLHTDRPCEKIFRETILGWTDSFEVADSTWAAFQSAMDLSIDHGLQIWDALILTVTADHRCRLLLSEDMQHGFTWRGVTVVNPYAPTSHSLLLAVIQPS